MIRALAILLFPLAVMAEIGDDCDYAGSQRQMNACAIRDYQIADADLNDAYAKAMLRAKDPEALRKAQIDWIKRRDARCKAKMNGPGTNVTIDYLSCKQDLTEVRTLQLLR